MGPGVRYLHGLGSISTAINEALGAVRREILTAQPDGARPSAVLKEALESVQPAHRGRHIHADAVPAHHAF